MKKWIAIVLCLCLVLGLSACGSKSASDSSYMREDSYASNSASYSKPAAESPMEPSYSEAEEYYDGEWDEPADDAGFGSNVVQVDYDKIIYTASTNVQTLDFEKSLEQVTALVEQFGGYIQSSSVTGTDISRKYKSYRSASFTLRIPTNRFAGFQNALRWFSIAAILLAIVECRLKYSATTEDPAA